LLNATKYEMNENRFIVQLKNVLLVIATTFSKFLISFEITFFNTYYCYVTPSELIVTILLDTNTLTPNLLKNHHKNLLYCFVNY
jgi:hypothetical protein